MTGVNGVANTLNGGGEHLCPIKTKIMSTLEFPVPFVIQ